MTRRAAPRYERAMQPEFWETRWREGRIGFHQGRPNDDLVAHAGRLDLQGARVLVPLCGKTADLTWLAGHARAVVGVELVTSAVEAFFAERGITPERSSVGALEAFTSGAITIYAGDYFALDATVAGHFDVCFDRAALVALPPALRTRYVEHTRSLLHVGARTLLVTFEHDGPTEEPPFSVPEEAVHAAFAHDEVLALGSRDAFEPAGVLAQRGATRASERVYLIERRA